MTNIQDVLPAFPILIFFSDAYIRLKTEIFHGIYC